MNRPTWRVSVATDDAKVVELSINGDTGQLFVAVSESGRAPEHVATFNRKTKSFDNLVDALIEASDELELASSPLAGANEPGDTAAGGEGIPT